MRQLARARRACRRHAGCSRTRSAEAPSAAAALELAAGLAARRWRQARGAREVLLAGLAGGIAIDVAVFDRQGNLIGHAGA